MTRRHILGIFFSFLIIFFIGFGLIKLGVNFTGYPTYDKELALFMKTCINDKDKDHCYDKVAQQLAEKYTFDQIKTFMVTNLTAQELDNCHTISHNIGREVYKKTGNYLITFTGSNLELCIYGFSHGALMQYFKAQGFENTNDKEKIKSKFVSVCKKGDIIKEVSQHVECVHGLGHIAMILSNNSLKESLEICDLYDTQIYRSMCHGGTFMENFMSTSVGSRNRIVEGENFDKPCGDIDPKYWPLCYYWKGAFFFVTSKGNFDGAVSLCLKVRSGYEKECLKRMTRVYTQANTGKLTEIYANCQKLKFDFGIESCINGAVESIIGDVGDKKNLRTFCEMTGEKIDFCYKVFFNAIDEWGSDTKEELDKECNFLLDEKYKARCFETLGKKFM